MSRSTVVRCGVPPVYSVLVSEQSEGKGGVGDRSDVELLAHLSETRCDGISAQ